MNKNYLETFVGFAVLVIALMFAFGAYKSAGVGGADERKGYNLTVNFDRIDGLSVGGEVRISGLKVGTVTSAKINSETYQANVRLNIADEGIMLPDDSTAEIVSAGLLGDKYIALVPGGSEVYLKNEGRILFSQPSISIESLIGKFMFGSSDEKEKKEGAESTF